MKLSKYRATPLTTDYAAMMQDFTPDDLPDYAPVRLPVLDEDEMQDDCFAGMILNFD
ncbi:MAG: hypothetical protein ACYC0N_02000 [Carboxydocellales bacterium]